MQDSSICLWPAELLCIKIVPGLRDLNALAYAEKLMQNSRPHVCNAACVR